MYLIALTKSRNPKAKSRNVRLKIETYERLDQYLIELMAEKGERLTLNDAVVSLLDEHYKHKSDNDRGNSA